MIGNTLYIRTDNKWLVVKEIRMLFLVTYPNYFLRGFGILRGPKKAGQKSHPYYELIKQRQ